ncbi:MAG: hypothetical protein AAGI07_13045, partial [Bacteroidota bacterium]
MKKKCILALLLYFLWSSYGLAQDQDDNKVNKDFELEVVGEYRYFYDNALFENQSNQFPSIAFKPKYVVDWDNGYQSINFEGFFRLDRDRSRTHGDIRELYYQKSKGNLDVSVGLKKIYWGVVESNH